MEWGATVIAAILKEYQQVFWNEWMVLFDNSFIKLDSYNWQKNAITYTWS